MLGSWLSRRRSQSRRTGSTSPPDNARLGHSDVSSISQSTTGPLQSPRTASDIPLDEVHACVNDPSLYAATPSLIHSAEKEATTLRASDAPAASLVDAPAYQHDGTSAPEGTLFTPQDAMLAQAFGKSVPPASHATPPESSTAPRPSASLMTSDSLPLPPPSMQTPPSSTRPGPALPIYDPFSGVKLGEHAPGAPFSLGSIPAVDDRRLWTSLERILELQAEIAVMHADLEGVSGKSGNHPSMVHISGGEGGKVGPRKRSRRGQTLPVGDEEPEEQEPEGRSSTGVAVSEISIDHSDGDGEEEVDEDMDDIHGQGRKRRDEEFARLAEQFAQRKVAIGGIMDKLDDLSMALKTFHALPPPLFDLASSNRTDTMSTAPSMSPTSSPHPLHVYSERPASPLSSISPSQAVSAITPPALSLTPPVPPISTLAPPVASRTSDAPPGVGPFAPVIPQMAVPTIIPGAPQVESPADMDPVHSIFRSMS